MPADDSNLMTTFYYATIWIFRPFAMAIICGKIWSTSIELNPLVVSAKQLFPLFVKDKSHMDWHCVLISLKNREETLSTDLKDFWFLAFLKPHLDDSVPRFTGHAWTTSRE